MSLDLDMKEIERKIYMYYHEDGLVDIALGLVFLGWGLVLAFDVPILIVLLGPMALSIYYFGKREITVPRVGIIDPSKGMASRMRNLALALLLIGTLALLGILLSTLDDNLGLENFGLAFVGLIIALGVAILAHIVHANRLYIYGLLLFVAFTAGEALSSEVTTVDTFLLFVTSAGFIIMVSGLVYVARFLRRYPLPEQEV